MKKQTKKLTLRVETLRNLGAPELAKAIGGVSGECAPRGDMTACCVINLVGTSSPSLAGRCDTDPMKKPTSCDPYTKLLWYLK